MLSYMGYIENAGTEDDPDLVPQILTFAPAGFTHDDVGMDLDGEFFHVLALTTDEVKQLLLVSCVTEDRSDDEHAVMLKLAGWLDSRTGSTGFWVAAVADTREYDLVP